MSARRIRISVEIGYAGIDIPNEYCELPDDWDEMSERERDELLSELAVNSLANYASSGACVVDENDEVVE